MKLAAAGAEAMVKPDMAAIVGGRGNAADELTQRRKVFPRR